MLDPTQALAITLLGCGLLFNFQAGDRALRQWLKQNERALQDRFVGAVLALTRAELR